MKLYERLMAALYDMQTRFVMKRKLSKAKKKSPFIY
jgi:hypothetical protein